MNWQHQVAVKTSPSVLGAEVIYDLERGNYKKTGKDVTLASKARSRGLYVIGKTGTGKSTFFINLILQDIVKGIGICFIDPVGDAINDVVSHLPVNKLQDVILLDVLHPDYTFGLNLYECANPLDQVLFRSAHERVMHQFKLLWGDKEHNYDLGVRVEEFLSNSAHTLVANQGYTLAEIPLLFRNEQVRQQFTSQVTNSMVLDFWDEYNELGRVHPREQLERRSVALNKVNRFLENDLVLQIVGQARTTIPFKQIMDDPTGKILLIKLTDTQKDLSQLVGAMIIAQLLEAAKSRVNMPVQERQLRQFNIYADEYHLFSTGDWGEMVEQARKLSVGTTFGHQRRSQLDFNSREGALQTVNVAVLRVSGKDAEEAAGEFDCKPIRTKKIQKLRLEPVYKEWDEEVWIDEEAHTLYETAEQLLDEVRTKIEPIKIELCGIMHVIEEIYFNNRIRKEFNLNFDGLRRKLAEKLLQDVPPNEYHSWHSLFFPTELFFNRGMTECPHCSEFISPVRKTDNVTRSGVVTLRDLRMTDTFPFFYIEEAYILPPLAALSSELGSAFRELSDIGELQTLAAELEQVLLRLFENLRFWFTFEYWKMNAGDPFLEDWEAIHYPLHGQERPITHWPRLGEWTVKGGFPQAVAWLKNKVEPLYAALTQFEQQEKELSDRMQLLKDQFYQTVHRKEYQGLLPADVSLSGVGQPSDTRYVHYDGEKPIEALGQARWYDLVEELDQTPAQRRDDIANELKKLPDLVARCILQEGDRPVERTVAIPWLQAGVSKAEYERRLRVITDNTYNKLLYYRDREKVKEEIRQRQAALCSAPVTQLPPQHRSEEPNTTMPSPQKRRRSGEG